MELLGYLHDYDSMYLYNAPPKAHQIYHVEAQFIDNQDKILLLLREKKSTSTETKSLAISSASSIFRMGYEETQ